MLNANLRFGKIEEVFAEGVHQYLTRFLNDIGAIGLKASTEPIWRPYEINHRSSYPISLCRDGTSQHSISAPDATNFIASAHCQLAIESARTSHHHDRWLRQHIACVEPRYPHETIQIHAHGEVEILEDALDDAIELISPVDVSAQFIVDTCDCEYA